MPEADGVTVGGAVAFNIKPVFYDLASTQAVDIVSSSTSDTATKVQVAGRDSTGTIQTPVAVTLTGTTIISSTFGGQTFQRLLFGVTSGGAVGSLTNPGGTAAVGDVAVMGHTRVISGHTAQAGSANTSGTTPPLFKLQTGDGATLGVLTFSGVGLIIYITGGTGAGQLRTISVPYSSGAYGADIVAVSRDWGTIPDATSTYDIANGFLFDILPNAVNSIVRCFSTSQADVPGGSSRTFYEKIFAVNTNAATALTSASIEVLSESPTLPSGALLDLALTKALNDTATTTNRQTLPTNGDSTSLTFVTQPSPINVIATPGSLPNGNTASVAQGMWLRLTLPAGTTVYDGAADVRVQGGTT
jgi:hypothetical protein